MKLLRDCALIVVLSPLLLLLGLHVGMLAYYLRRFLRVPYLLGVVLLQAAEMLAVACWLQNTPWAVSLGIFGGLLLVTVLWHVISCRREQLIEGCNLEYLASVHVLFVLAVVMLHVWPLRASA